MRDRLYADYDRTFREEAVKMVLKGDRPVEHLSVELGVPHSTLRRWYKLEMAKGRARDRRRGHRGASE
jgi:transposase-like protein